MNFLLFVLTFAKIGTITYGGGLAMIPLLQDFAISNQWLSIADFTDLIAISQSTPGPIAINLATFIGFRQYGIIGALLASIAVVAPGIIFVMIVSKFLELYKENITVKWTLQGLKVSVIGLLGMAVYQVGRVAFFNNAIGHIQFEALDYKAVILFIAAFVMIQKTKWHPVFYLTLGGILGVMFW